MRIARAEIFRFELPLTRPLTINREPMTARSGLLLRVVSDSGCAGWGEISPLRGFSRESLEESRDQALALRGSVEAIEIPDGWTPLADEIPSVFHAGDWCSAVRFGLELALWNLGLNAGRVRPPGGSSKSRHRAVLLNGLLTGKADDIREQARALVRAGYKAVKLKLGARPLAEEIRLTSDIGEIIGDRAALRLDANRSWSLDEAVEFGKAAKGLNIDYIEEPLSNPDDLSMFFSKTGVPIALDETLVNTPIDRAGEIRGVKAAVVKANLLGGFHAAFRLALKARELGLVPVVSSTFETGIGIAGLARLAAAVSEGIPVGLDTYRWLARDILVPGIETDGGRIDLSLLETRHDVDRTLLHELADD